MDNVKRVVSELLELHKKLLSKGQQEHFEFVEQKNEMSLRASDPEFDRASSQAGLLIDEINRILTEYEWEPPNGTTIRQPREGWIFGVVTRHAPLRQIIRGFVKPMRQVPLASNLPDKVVLYLITMLPGARDGLDRDIHGGIGYHYHYLDRRRRRSDVILSFDTRWQLPLQKTTKPLDALRPLFVERHAPGKAHFTARPGNWSDEKRKSIYTVCSNDLGFGISRFLAQQTSRMRSGHVVSN